MVKLTAAKCPSCGASLEVNKKLEKAMCQYCGDTILIEDAIAKIKVEHSGKVKVSSVKDSSDKIEIARKYIKVGKDDEALHVVSDVLEENPFDIDALIISNDVYFSRIDDYIKIISGGRNVKRYDEIEMEFGKDFREYTEKDDRDNIDRIVSTTRKFYKEISSANETITKIDDDKEYEDYLKNSNKKLKEVDEILTKKEQELRKVADSKSDAFKRLKSFLDKTDNPRRYLKKVAKKCGMKNFKPGDLVLGFKLEEVKEDKIVYSDGLGNYASYNSDEKVSFDKIIEVIENEEKKYNTTMVFLMIIPAIPALALLFNGHWFLAILLYVFIVGGIAELHIF